MGFSFAEAAGFRLLAEQLSAGRVQLWSTTAVPSDVTFMVASQSGNAGPRMLVGVEVSASISDDLGDFSGAAKLPFDSVVCLRPSSGCGEIAVRSESDAVALTLSLKQVLRKLRGELRAKEIHLVLCCPASLALFIGHRLNALGIVYGYERTVNGDYCATLQLPTG